MVPLVIAAAILLLFIKEKPLATTIERDILPESLDIDGASHVLLDDSHDLTTTDASVSRAEPEKEPSGRP